MKLWLDNGKFEDEDVKDDIKLYLKLLFFLVEKQSEVRKIIKGVFQNIQFVKSKLYTAEEAWQPANKEEPEKK